MTQNNFSFNISLSVLNHLGRNLYRSFITVLGEAISNSWDADARNVWISIDRENNKLFIKDDGIGMSSDDFQNKFLKIGYSKRKGGKRNSDRGRPYIGRKGIGKLALLSCADKITIISKKQGEEYIGGCIDNSGLDKAIKDDLAASQYNLDAWKLEDFSDFTKRHESGTIILFENIRGGIKNTLDYIKKVIALYFRFSLLDPNFNIFVDGEKITSEHIREIGEKTQFIWTINDYDDPFLKNQAEFSREKENLETKLNIKGFIATVQKPSNLTIRGMDEKVTLDFFVNGRLREKNILKSISPNKIVENYIYGQIHYDELDDDEDPFTSSREGVVSDNKDYTRILKELKANILPHIIETWDDFRRKYGNDGDPENTKKITPRERKSEELYNLVSSVSDDEGTPHFKKKTIVDEWVDELREDASFCFSSYAECYVSENILRRYILEKKFPISGTAKSKVSDYRKQEAESKGRGNISIEIRKEDCDLSYLSMSDLAALLDKKDRQNYNSLHRDSYEYKPMRDAIMHTAQLSEMGKSRLTLSYENVKGRIKQLLEENKSKK